MSRNVRLACVVGTRPEVVKMAPVVLRLRRPGSGFDVCVLATGQHRELLDVALADFGLKADADLALMRPGQSLAELTARALTALTDWLDQESPDFVLAQGDTTTVLAAALACQYARIPFGHVEAGLRTGDPGSPFPEEMNRVVAGQLAEIHFAPTASARRNLLREGIAPGSVHVVGNPVIDALRMIADREVRLPLAPTGKRFLLVTTHRRESFGAPLEGICQALTLLVRRFEDLSVVFPVHPNPKVRAVVEARLGGIDRVHLIDPVGYAGFVGLMKAAALILTDSGGVQEEAPALGKPVLVLRDRSERPEAIASGAARLVGTRPAEIVSAAERILDRPEPLLFPFKSPYGDGLAAERIAHLLAGRFGLDAGAEPPGLWNWPEEVVRRPHFRQSRGDRVGADRRTFYVPFDLDDSG
ncbi:UDP-N-acetylglucosamine 2-epimerase (non-hydrolyzing) [soil metagenome]